MLLNHYLLNLHRKDVPVLLCGDFNIQPHSPVYSFLKSGFLPASDPSLTYDKKPVLPKEGRFNKGDFPHAHSDKLIHDLDLASLYGDTVGEPPCTSSWLTLDYVWHSKRRLRPLGLLLTPTNKKILTDMPNEWNPSDHLPLVGEFLLLPPTPLPDLETQQKDTQTENQVISKDEDKRKEEEVLPHFNMSHHTPEQRGRGKGATIARGRGRPKRESSIGYNRRGDQKQRSRE